MVSISEFLPNPIGKDTEGEWIELYNSGPAINLAGWRIENKKGQSFFLGGTIKEGEYKVLWRQNTKLVLHNDGEELKLFNAEGKMVHSSSLMSAAPEGKSVISLGSLSRLAEPTPGTANSVQLAQLSNPVYPAGTVLNPQPSGFLPDLLMSSILVVFAVIFVAKRNEKTSKLLFEADKGIGF